MKLVEFEMLKRQFVQGDTDKKIEIYLTAHNATQEQYLELLRLFPVEELGRLERELSAVEK